VLVEGQLDALRCVEQGIPTAVAPQGTAITETQLLQLRRLTGKIDCLLDGDDAGRRAALRILPMCLKLGLEIRFLTLPQGSDPDDLLRNEGKTGLDRLRENALDAMSYAVQALIPANATPRDRSLGLQKIFEMLLQGESEVMRQDYLQQISRLAGVERLALEQDFERFIRARTTPPARLSPTSDSPPPPPESSTLSSPKLTTAESDLLFVLLHQADLAGPTARLVDPAWINADTLHGTLLRRLLAEIIENGGELPTHWDDLLESEPERNTLYAMLGTSLRMDSEPEDLKKIVNTCIKHLYTQHHDRTRHSLEQQLINTADLDLQKKLQQQRIALRNELRAFNQNPPQLTFD
jgi:DNA primase